MTKRAWCAAAALVFAAGLVFADVAMPRDKWTPIRMASENVKIVLTPAKVTVEATFILENEKDAVTAVVGYPRGVLEKSLDDFAVRVDGEKVDVSSQAAKPAVGPDFGPPPKKGEPLKPAYQFAGPYPEWKTFNVKFDAKQKRTVVVSYSVAPAEVETEKGKVLTYVYTMKTGATWSGNIDKASIEATLDGIMPYDLVATTPKAAIGIETGHLHWTFKDFKPTQDIEITFPAPK